VLRRVAFTICILSVISGAQAQVRVHGGTTVAFGIMKPQQARIEELAGTGIVILPSSTTNGLTDLAQGRADIAMLAEPLETAAVAVNRKSAGLINPTEYESAHVGDALVQFIVHPSNPIRKLTKAQLAALYSGQITNWSELGGHDQQVLIVVEPTSSPYRMIRDALGIVYRSDARVIQNTNQSVIIAAQAPGALGNISTAHDAPERGRIKVIETELKQSLPLYLAYRKDAPAEVKRVIDAVAKAGKP
jgi:phosphate transport system substrate-binding protein